MSAKEKIYKKDENICAEVIFSSDIVSSSTKGKPTSAALEVEQRLKDMGFNIIGFSPYSISIYGTRNQYEEKFGVTIMYSYPKIGKKTGIPELDIQYSIAGEPVIPDALKNMVKTLEIPPLVRFHLKSPPTPQYPHLNLNLRRPVDIATELKANVQHDNGITGRNIDVAMIDSGLDKSHWWYQNTNGGRYNIKVNPTNSSDYIGHGTAMAANLLSIAPDCKFKLHSMFPQPAANASFSLKTLFNTAVGERPQVISISMDNPYDAELAQNIVEKAIDQDITVVASVGNKGNSVDAAFPSCIPEVISVGGAYYDKGTLTASNFAQSGCNPQYPGRQCPDVCGLCGKKSKGILIVMPTQAHSVTETDLYNGNAKYPNGDRTAIDIGWCVGSGTSAATAQVAGAVALLLNAKANLRPAEIKTILEETATDVETGQSATHKQARKGFDEATGYGLINIDAAVEKAKTY